MKGSFQTKQEFVFFSEQKIECMSVKVWIFKNHNLEVPLYLLQRLNMGLDQHDSFFLVL